MRPEAVVSIQQKLQPTLLCEERSGLLVLYCPFCHCNPRSCARSDKDIAVARRYYRIATHAPVRGAICSAAHRATSRAIATHAPVRGAIGFKGPTSMFQDIATHAPVRGAIAAFSMS